MSTATATPAKVLEPGVYPGLSERAYDQLDAVRNSLLTKFARTPAHAREHIEAPDAPTPAMILGQAVHRAILQPDTLNQFFARSTAQEKRTKADKVAWAEVEAAHPDCHILRPGEWDHVLRMRDAVWVHPTAQRLLSGPGKVEHTLVWRDKPTDVLCKARLDRLIGHYVSEWDQMKWPAIVDVKTTRDASDREFSRSVRSFAYDVQAAHYLAGAEALAPCDRKWVFVCVENVPPHCVRVLELEPAGLELGQKLRRRYLNTYAECIRTDTWPGYGDQVAFIGPPHWAYKEEGVDRE